jgi:hypothetical protein
MPPPLKTGLSTLLELSRKQRHDFAALPDRQKKTVAERELKKLGVLTKSGKLAAAFR